jgi:transposase
VTASADDDRTSLRAEVMRLHYLEGLSIRCIARKLSIARKTVRQHLGRLPPRPASEPGKRPSILDAHDETIRQLLLETPDLKATQILERLRHRGYRGGISVLRTRVRELRPSPTPSVHLTVNHHPAETMQVDWADFGFALPGVPRRVSAFVALLPYSRQLYLEFVLSQAMGSFLRCMDRALLFFGGVTHADVFDI